MPGAGAVCYPDASKPFLGEPDSKPGRRRPRGGFSFWGGAPLRPGSGSRSAIWPMRRDRRLCYPVSQQAVRGGRPQTGLRGTTDGFIFFVAAPPPSVIHLLQIPPIAQHMKEEHDQHALQRRRRHIAVPDTAGVAPPDRVHLPVLLDAQRAVAVLAEDEGDRAAVVVGLGKDQLTGGPGARHGSA